MCLIAQSSVDIRSFIDQNKSQLDLTTKDLAEYTIADMYTSRHLGLTHIYLQQKYSDIKVHNGILNINISNDQLVSFGNRWIADIESQTPSNIPEINAQSAVINSTAHLGQTIVSLVEINREKNNLGQDIKVMFEPGGLSRLDISAELMWLQGMNKEVWLCWRVEVYENEQENRWHIFIDAHSGAFIKKDNLVIKCSFDTPTTSYEGMDLEKRSRLEYCPPAVSPDSAYNVFAMPVESPSHGMRSIVVTPWDSSGAGNFASTLGWHNDGATDYTITRGNNVYAYEDTDANNSPGFSPDTSTLQFDYPFDPLLSPADNMEAAITNLFYWNNIIHDVMYQYGFDEVSGNFQSDNLDRGGNDGDPVLAEAQDGGGTNSANFFTPSDGSSGRMQMFLWSDVPASFPLEVNSPLSIAGDIYALESDFSSANKLADIGTTTGVLVLVEDSGAETYEACGTLSNADSLSGKIAVIDRGNCDFVDKVKTVQDLGAIAVVMVNNVSGAPIVMGGTDNSITIPAVMVSLSDGMDIKAVLDTAIVNVTLDSVGQFTPDSDFDSGIIAHEYGHGISNRLTGGPSSVNCLNNDEQMGEGWSDFFGLILNTDWASASDTDSRGIGTYVLGEPANGAGVRTYPYSSDTLINPFTYADIADAPITNGNVSPHYIGSVWATMLWDMTWNIIDIAGIDTDIYHGTGGNNIALQLVIDGLKLQPCNPGFVDGRDAILLADELLYGGLYKCAIWQAFADRGLGVDADQGSTSDHEDGVESYGVPAGIIIESAAAVVQAIEGQEVTFAVKVRCECVDKTNIVIDDLLSDDLVYVQGSGGIITGNIVAFDVDSLNAQDSLDFSYRAVILACSAVDPTILSADNAEGPDQYTSIKLAGNGNKKWDKSSAQFVSPSNSWYAKDYHTLADIALTLDAPVMTTGPVEITFQHRYETEANYDGGVVEYSFNNGSTWLDAGPHFIENGYPASINTVNTNSTIAGRAAFTGDSDAQFDTTGFIQSTIQLCTGSSQSLLLRFRFACDGSVAGSGINGWYVDDISIDQHSGIVNKTRVTIEDSLVDSLSYCLATTYLGGNAIYVDQSATGDLHGGAWSDAIHHLPTALEIAGCRALDSIFVAEGSYLPNLNDDRQLSFILPDSASIYGGFPSGGSSFALRDPATNVTVMSGDIGIQNDSSDNVYHIVKVTSDQKALFLDGVTLAYGNADGEGDDDSGAAIFNEGELIMHNVTTSFNHGLTDGHIVLNKGINANLELRNCKIYSQIDSLIQILNIGSGQIKIEGNTEIIQE